MLKSTSKLSNTLIIYFVSYNFIKKKRIFGGAIEMVICQVTCLVGVQEMTSNFGAYLRQAIS